MKRISLFLVLGSLTVAASASSADLSKLLAPPPTHPATQEWVQQYVAQHQITYLTAATWAAACDSGSVTSAGGCFGNVSSAGFQALSNGLRGFQDWMNVATANAPNSVFIKKFLGTDGNPAVTGTDVNVTVSGSAAMARCEMFMEQGHMIDYNGIYNYDNDSNRSSEGPDGEVYQIPNGTTTGVTASESDVTTAPVVKSGHGIYLICIGVTTFSNPVAASIAGTTAVWG